MFQIGGRGLNFLIDLGVTHSHLAHLFRARLLIPRALASLPECSLKVVTNLSLHLTLFVAF